MLRVMTLMTMDTAGAMVNSAAVLMVFLILALSLIHILRKRRKASPIGDTKGSRAGSISKTTNFLGG